MEGDVCSIDGCDGFEGTNTCGLCPDCWLNLEPFERAILKGEEPPVEKRITNETVRTVIPPRPGFIRRASSLLWRVGMTGAMAYVLWKRH